MSATWLRAPYAGDVVLQNACSPLHAPWWEQIQSIILINAGGTTDILQEFNAVEGQALALMTFYIIDSHRPLNLSNVYDEDRVIIFDDGEVSGAPVLPFLNLCVSFCGAH